MSRKLVHIEKIIGINPIPGADNIDLAQVLGWKVIVKKGEFQIGDLAVYFEIDSQLPVEERYSFLASRKYRVKTWKLNKFNIISQGLLISLDMFPEITRAIEGQDITNLLNVTKIETDEEKRLTKEERDSRTQRFISRYRQFTKTKLGKWIMRHPVTRKIVVALFGGKKVKPKGFPQWIEKTDEVRVENIWTTLQDNKEKWIQTEKIDGTSCTYAIDFFKKKKDYIVCSRNVRQLNKDQLTYFNDTPNVYWEMADKYNIFPALERIAYTYGIKRIILQGEIIGEKLQGNPLKIKGREFYGFNLIFDGERLNSERAKEIINPFGINWVPIIKNNYILPNTIEEIKKQSTGASLINENVLREGYVYRSLDGIRSFKNVSPEYLLKNNL